MTLVMKLEHLQYAPLYEHNMEISGSEPVASPNTLKRLHFAKHFPHKLVYGSKSQKSWNWTENWQTAKQPERFSIFYEASNKS